MKTIKQVPVIQKASSLNIINYLIFLSQVILGIIVAWIVCAIVTAAGGFPDDPKSPQYLARTDARTQVLSEASWFRFPYPGKITSFINFVERTIS